MKNTCMVANHYYPVPSCMNELTKTQQVLLAMVWHTTKDLQRLQWLSLMILLQLWKRPRLTWNWYLWLNQEDRANNLVLLEFLLYNKEERKKKQDYLTQCKIGQVKGLKCAVPEGSNDMLGHLVYRQFIACEVAFVRYHHALKENNPEDAEKELAILCGNVYTYNGQWYHHDEERYERDGAKIPKRYQWAISWWYEGCRNDWMPMFPNVYPTHRQAQGDELKGKIGEFDDGGNSWAHVLKKQAGNAIYVKEMAYTAADIALSDLNDKLREAEEREEMK